jgi:hypothetical protein
MKNKQYNIRIPNISIQIGNINKKNCIQNSPKTSETEQNDTSNGYKNAYIDQKYQKIVADKITS